MGKHHEKPDTPEELVAKHHGIKGMHWGVRNKEDTGSGNAVGKPVSVGRKPMSTPMAKEAAASNSSMKLMMAESVKLDKQSKPSEAKLMATKQDWLNKFSSDGATPGQGRVQPMVVPKERKKLTPTQKKLLKNAAIGVGVAGGLYLLNKQAKKALGYTPIVEGALKGNHKGLPISSGEFNTLVAHSQFKTWSTGNFITKESWEREGFTLDVGHEFHRLSQMAESTFTKPTYSVSNQDDWNRYLTNFRHEKGPGAAFHEVSWKLTQPVKVPALKDIIQSTQEVLRAEGGTGTEKEAISAYKAMSGKNWTSDQSKSLVKVLKGKGYGALVDEMDAGVIGDKPLVFFAHSSATAKQSKKLSQSAFVEAEKLVKELQNRKT